MLGRIKNTFGNSWMWLIALLFAALIYRLGALWFALPYANVFGDELPHTIAAFNLLEKKTIIASFPFYYLPPLMAYILAPIFALIGVVGIAIGSFADLAAFKGFVLLYREYFLAVSRVISALFGVATIPVLFLLTRKLFNSTVAWIAIILFAFDFWNIHEAQIGHIWSPMIFFMVASFYYFYVVYESGARKSDHVMSGLLMGLGYGMGQIPIILYVWYALAYALSKIKNNKNFIFGSAIFAALVVAFSVLNTETFINHFSSSIQSIAKLFGYKFASLPYAPKIARFSLANNWHVITWAFFNNNPFTAVLGAMGLALIACKKRVQYTTTVVVGFPIFYLALFSFVFYSFTYRYIMPALLFFIIGEAYFIYVISQYVERGRRITLVVLAGIVLSYSIALDTLYFTALQKPYTESSAIEWIYKNIPERSKIVSGAYITPNKAAIDFLRSHSGWADSRKMYLASLPDAQYPHPDYFVIESNLLDITKLTAQEREVDYLYIRYYNRDHLAENHLELFPDRKLVVSFYPKETVEDISNPFNMDARGSLLEYFWSLEALGPYTEIYRIGK
ncbi:MAG: phospholipid carrier-dependent glycosyltransferase [Patescibacteria group bacterium]